MRPFRGRVAKKPAFSDGRVMPRAAHTKKTFVDDEYLLDDYLLDERPAGDMLKGQGEHTRMRNCVTVALTGREKTCGKVFKAALLHPKLLSFSLVVIRLLISSYKAAMGRLFAASVDIVGIVAASSLSCATLTAEFL